MSGIDVVVDAKLGVKEIVMVVNDIAFILIDTIHHRGVL